MYELFLWFLILGNRQQSFKYLGTLLTNQNSIQEEIKCGLKAGNSCYYSVQTLTVHILIFSPY